MSKFQLKIEIVTAFCLLKLPPAAQAGMVYTASHPRLMLADKVTPEQMSGSLGIQFAKPTWWYRSALCSFARLLLFEK